MKVMVVLDDDGHCTVIEFNVANMKKALKHLIDIGRCDKVEGTALLNDTNTTAEQIEGYFRGEHCTGRSGGGQFYIVDLKERWAFGSGPWW